jgi:hypothetical protein
MLRALTQYAVMLSLIIVICLVAITALGTNTTRLMLAMDGNDECTGEVLRLEGAKRWVAGIPNGFAVLLQALQEEAARRR